MQNLPLAFCQHSARWAMRQDSQSCPAVHLLSEGMGEGAASCLGQEAKSDHHADLTTVHHFEWVRCKEAPVHAQAKAP